MRNLNHVGLYKVLLLAGAAGIIATAAPAAGQERRQGDPDCSNNPLDPACAEASAAADASANGRGPSSPTPAGAGTIVVTGSRIARQDYVANSPTVTVDETFLKQSSTAAIEEQLNRLPQFVVAQSSTTLNGVSGTGGWSRPAPASSPAPPARPAPPPCRFAALVRTAPWC